MKTKDLIAKLMDADPSGELEVSVDGKAINRVHREPFVGGHQTLIKDHSKDPYYNIIGFEFVTDAVCIENTTYEDVLYNQPDAISKYETEYLRKRWESTVEKVREDVFELRLDLESKNFGEYVAEKFGDVFKDQAISWARENLNPQEICPVEKGMSYNTTRKKQWDSRILVSVSAETINFKKQ